MKARTHAPAHLSICVALAGLAACAGQGRRDLRLDPVRSPYVMTATEIAESNGTTAYDAIERRHPMFLMSQLDLGPTEARQVYLNGVHLGGLGQLRFIPAKEVKEIRFVRAIEAGAYGVGRSGGAILVISKAGR